MKIFKLLLLTVAGTVVLLGGMAWWSRHSEPNWPHFPEAAANSDGRPQVLIEYDEPFDFGYRTGHLIPLKVLVKVPPTASIEPDTLAVTGDLQLVSKHQFFQDAEDGTRYYRFDLELRSFVYKPKLAAKAGLSYRLNSDNEVRLLETESIEIYPSKTFDGRKMGHPKDPVLKPIQGYHGAITGSMILLGLVGMVLCARTLYRRRRALQQGKTPTPSTVKDDPFARANLAYDAVLAGNVSDDSLRELVRSLRVAYKVPQTSYGQLQENFAEHDWSQPLGIVLQICEDACIWRQAPITEADIEMLRDQRKLLISLS